MWNLCDSVSGYLSDESVWGVRRAQLKRPSVLEGVMVCSAIGSKPIFRSCNGYYLQTYLSNHFYLLLCLDSTAERKLLDQFVAYTETLTDTTDNLLRMASLLSSKLFTLQRDSDAIGYLLAVDKQTMRYSQARTIDERSWLWGINQGKYRRDEHQIELLDNCENYRKRAGKYLSLVVVGLQKSSTELAILREALNRAKVEKNSNGWRRPLKIHLDVLWKSLQKLQDSIGARRFTEESFATKQIGSL